MDFSRKIYYYDKAFILTTNRESYIEAHPWATEYDCFDGATAQSFNRAVQYLDRPGSKGVFIEDFSEESLLSQLHIMYRSIAAGGGLTYNENGEVLLIFRRGKWDLPKGKLDEGEQIDECSLREVQEETGLEHLELDGKLCDTFHIYGQNNENLLKSTTWYKMKGKAADKLKPQKEEDIMEARWVAEKDLAAYAAKSYEAVRDVLRAAGLQWS